jgi:hypothetical protein
MRLASHQSLVPPSFKLGAVFLGLAILLGACDMPPDAETDVATKTAALNGSIVFTNCAPEEQLLLTQAMTIVKFALIDGVGAPQAMLSCLNNNLMAGGVTNVREADYPELILQRLRENVPTQIECASTLPPDADSAIAWVFLGTGEKMFFLKSELQDYIHGGGTADAQATSVADVMGHELAHTKDYRHPTTSFVAPDYGYSVPYTVGSCVSQLWTHKYVDGRTSTKGEVNLAPVGLYGGLPAGNNSGEVVCGQNKYVVGFHGRSGTAIDNLGLVCDSGGFGQVSDTPAFGGTGGGAFRQVCNAGEFAVGAWGNATDIVNFVGLYCASKSSIMSGSRAAGQRGGTGGNGTAQWIRGCPSKMVLKGVRMRTGPYVNRMELLCQELGSSRKVENFYVGGSQVPGNARSVVYHEGCPSGVVRRVMASTGSAVDRLMGTCLSVVDTTPGLNVLEEFRPGNVLPGHGGDGGGFSFVDLPDANSAFVGVRIAGGNGRDWINSIVMLSTRDMASWSRGVTTHLSASTRLGAVTGAWETETICPVGSFITGWWIKAGDSSGLNVIEGLMPACGRF